MPNTPTLHLSLRDVKENLLRQPCTVRLRHQTSGVLTVVRTAAKKSVAVHDLSPGVYSLQVDPASYRAVGAFVEVTPSRVTRASLNFPIDPVTVKRVTFPAFGSLDVEAQRVLAASSGVLGYEGASGQDLYSQLDDDRVKKAGLLNILAKTSAVALSNKRGVSSYIQELVELRGDRFFAVVPKELREETKNSIHDEVFQEVPGGLHHPPVGFTPAGSFKTNDHYGNLQLTFFTDGTDWRADIDIDDANGLAHVFQVLRNELTGQPTHPYDIHEILIRHQKLDPGYTFDV
jgi:hypothetical protein